MSFDRGSQTHASKIASELLSGRDILSDPRDVHILLYIDIL